jgi:hypothetical protein
MPTAPYAEIRASLNGGAIQTGGITAAGGEVVQLTANPSGLAGATQYLWEILSFPPALTVPSGWSTDASGHYYYSGQTPPPFTLRTATEFGKYILRLTLNGGGPTLTARSTVAERTAIGALVDVATAIDVLSSNGLHDLGFYESTQFSSDGWVAHHRENLRTLNDSFGSGGGSGGTGLEVEGTPSTGDVPKWNGTDAVWSAVDSYAMGFAATTSMVECSQSVVSPAFTASHTETPISLLLTNNLNGESKNVLGTPTSFTSSQTYQRTTPNQTVVFTLSGSDGITSPVRTATMTWGQRVYWGNKVPGTHNAAFVTGLPSSGLQTTGNKTFTATAGGTENLYFAFPTRLGSATVVIGGFTYSWTVISTTISVTNAQGFAENYTLIQNENLGVGAKTVAVTVS